MNIHTNIHNYYDHGRLDGLYYIIEPHAVTNDTAKKMISQEKLTGVPYQLDYNKQAVGTCASKYMHLKIK